MNGRRALTLLEVLAATVLLAMMTVACLPLVRTSLRALDAPAPVVEVRELAALADAFVRDPASLLEIDPEDGGAPGVIPWPDDPDRPVVTVTRLAGGPPAPETPGEDPTAPPERAPDRPGAIEHEWLVFRCDGVIVCRWVGTVREEAP